MKSLMCAMITPFLWHLLKKKQGEVPGKYGVHCVGLWGNRYDCCGYDYDDDVAVKRVSVKSINKILLIF